MIKQRTQMDCMLCCLAKATGRTYDETLIELGPLGQEFAEKGCLNNNDHVALSILEFENNVDYLKLHMRPEYCNLGFLRNMLFGRRAILTGKSKNVWEQWHTIYWDGFNLYDPSNGATYSNIFELEPIEIIIFNERTMRK